ncbi:MAG: prephenate dehydratase domain-containing protein [Gemmatimonadaceae bacterium]
MTRPLVAFQGEVGAFSEDAIEKFFGPSTVTSVPHGSFDDVVTAVVNGRTDYGIIPVENVIAGVIVDAERAIEASDLRTIGEVAIPIEQCLLAVPRTRLEDVSKVLSHPAALAQCRKFFSLHSEMEAVAVGDTAGAAREVAHAGDRAVSAIAARRAATIYGLDVLAVGIQDDVENKTRFVVLVR